MRFGSDVRWVTKQVSGTAGCSTTYFGSDPAFGTGKHCEVRLTVLGVVQTGTLPVVNMALMPKPADPFKGPRMRQLSAGELTQGNNQPSPTDVGSFREPCGFSHMGFNDPIALSNMPNASHLHTFFGNSNTDASSTPDSLLNTGDSTCVGGTLNRTGYWVPTLIDTRTGQPIVPDGSLFYYKQGYLGVKAGTMQAFPKGLRMIAGDTKSTSPWGSPHSGLECSSGGGHQASIPSCAIGDSLNISVIFPQCWDGVNLDSPDHKSHMAYATGNGCPSTHPVPLPEIALNVHYAVTEANSGAFLKLSSDNYSGPGGYSMHADWFNGWDPATNKTFLDNCINANKDCHAYLLGDGTTLY